MPLLADPNVLRGLTSLDDAGVYKLTDSIAIIQTIDFFVPIVDDPYAFGQIAAANALSDIYAMGGKPLTALNIVCFPNKSLSISTLKDILRGGADKVREAGAVLVGGHSVEDTELKYGLAITGVVHPNRFVTNAGAEAGDKIILTKPLGTGIVSTALEAKKASEETVRKITKYMATLNAKASQLMQEVGVHACTDVTGFSLLGHAWQLTKYSQVGIRIDSASVPFFIEALEFAKEKLNPSGLQRNKDFYSVHVNFSSEIPAHVEDALFDPQTSGGLLICLPSDKADTLQDKLQHAGIKDAAIIGEVLSEATGKVIVS